MLGPVSFDRAQLLPGGFCRVGLGLKLAPRPGYTASPRVVGRFLHAAGAWRSQFRLGSLFMSVRRTGYALLGDSRAETW